MAESATRKAPARAVATPSRDNLLPPLRVKYYRKMKRRRTYPMVVGWKYAERGVAGKEVTLRLVVGGALVVPAEQTLNPADPEDAVTFHITPLTKGRLGDPHLDVVYQGRKVQEMSLPAKVSSQRLTWFFLLAALLVPWLLLEFCKYGPLQDPGLTPGQTVNKVIRDNVPELPRAVKDSVPQAETWLRDLRDDIADGYEDLCALCREQPIAFYVGCGFLGLAFLSLLWHADRRKRRLGKPIPIPAPA